MLAETISDIHRTFPWAVLWVEKLIAVAVILQTLELLRIREEVDEIWRWEILRDDFFRLPELAREVVGFFLSEKHFPIVLFVRLLAAASLLFVPHAFGLSLLILTSLLISLRWRGSFNGGSDYMTLVILTALFVTRAFDGAPQAVSACLWYISIQTCLSYFISGCAKLKHKAWLTGRALPPLLSTSIYKESALIEGVAVRPVLCAVLSWSVLAFECSFPLALLSPAFCAFYIGLGFMFHLAIFYVLGLNRFLFAWVAAYPALFFCSLRGY